MVGEYQEFSLRVLAPLCIQSSSHAESLRQSKKSAIIGWQNNVGHFGEERKPLSEFPRKIFVINQSDHFELYRSKTLGKL
jgi:hypothetical protein